MGETAKHNMEESSYLLNERDKFPIETWPDNAHALLNTLWLRMRITGLAWKISFFKRYLSMRNNIHGAINFRLMLIVADSTFLIVSSASSFWDFRIPPFIKIGIVRAARRRCKYDRRVKSPQFDIVQLLCYNLYC